MDGQSTKEYIFHGQYAYQYQDLRDEQRVFQDQREN